MRNTKYEKVARWTAILAALGAPWVADATMAAPTYFPVQITAGGYDREYVIDGRIWTSGDQSINLLTGNHTFSNLTASFSFILNQDGTVISNAPTSAAANGNTLTLQTVAIEIDPRQYTRLYQVYGGQQISGRHEVTSIIALADSLIGPAETSIATFTADANGGLTLQSGADSVDVSTGLIQFRNVSYSINAASYDRPFIPFSGPWLTGSAEVVGIPSATDGISTAMTSEIARFTVDSNGTIHLISGQDSVQTASASITFNNVSLSVDPQAWPRMYTPTGGRETAGASRFVAIPGVEDQITTLSSQVIVRFTVDHQQSINVLEGAAQVKIEGPKIVFNNVQISITPENYANGYDFLSGGRHFGAQTEVMIPSVAEAFEFPNQPSQNAAVSVEGNAFAINGTVVSPAMISLSGGSAIVFGILEATSVAKLDTGSGSNATTSDSTPTVAAGGGCVPSAQAGEIGGPNHTGSNIADLFSSPLGIGLIFFLIRRARRARAAA